MRPMQHSKRSSTRMPPSPPTRSRKCTLCATMRSRPLRGSIGPWLNGTQALSICCSTPSSFAMSAIHVSPRSAARWAFRSRGRVCGQVPLTRRGMPIPMTASASTAFAEEVAPPSNALDRTVPAPAVQSA
jgi:hypothetical protein